jgi:hypothetical protein
MKRGETYRVDFLGREGAQVSKELSVDERLLTGIVTAPEGPDQRADALVPQRAGHLLGGQPHPVVECRVVTVADE